jgi:hypothetical protein
VLVLASSSSRLREVPLSPAIYDDVTKKLSVRTVVQKTYFHNNILLKMIFTTMTNVFLSRRGLPPHFLAIPLSLGI